MVASRLGCDALLPQRSKDPFTQALTGADFRRSTPLEKPTERQGVLWFHQMQTMPWDWLSIVYRLLTDLYLVRQQPWTMSASEESIFGGTYFWSAAIRDRLLGASVTTIA